MSDATDGGTDLRGDATEATRAANAEMAAGLDFADRRDFDEAERGLIAPLPDGGKVIGADGGPSGTCRASPSSRTARRPPTPSTPACGGSRSSCARAACSRSCPASTRCARSTSRTSRSPRATTGSSSSTRSSPPRPRTRRSTCTTSTARRKPVVAVVYSHSHVDHYGGVRGIVDEADVAAGKVQIIAPIGFLEAAVAENVLAGNVMSRRASYMYGNLLPADPKGQVGAGPRRRDLVGHDQPDPADRARHRDRPAHDDRRPGLRVHARARHRGAGGDALVHRAVQGASPPPRTAATRCTTPTRSAAPRSATRSPGRSTCSRPSSCGATASRSCTACTTGRRGAATGCSRCSAWPATATASSTTRRCASRTTASSPSEIAEQVQFPPTLGRHWAMRGYYGTLNHNVRATYVNYLGWFDGNPATLHTLSARGGRQALRRVHGRRRRRAGQGARRVRAGRLPLGRRGRQPRRLRRPGQQGRPRAAGRGAGAARLPVGVRPVAQLLPHGRAGAPARRPAAAHPQHRQPRHRPRHEHSTCSSTTSACA